MTNENDWVFDPFLGVGSSIIAAIRNNRKGVGSEIKNEYVEIAKNRIKRAIEGTLKVRPMDQPKYDPYLNGNNLIHTLWNENRNNGILQMTIFEENEDKVENR